MIWWEKNEECQNKKKRRIYSSSVTLSKKKDIDLNIEWQNKYYFKKRKENIIWYMFGDEYI